MHHDSTNDLSSLHKLDIFLKQPTDSCASSMCFSLFGKQVEAFPSNITNNCVSYIIHRFFITLPHVRFCWFLQLLNVNNVLITLPRHIYFLLPTVSSSVFSIVQLSLAVLKRLTAFPTRTADRISVSLKFEILLDEAGEILAEETDEVRPI